MMLITNFNDEVISNIIGFLHKDELSNLSLMSKEVTQETQKEILVRWYSQSCFNRADEANKRKYLLGLLRDMTLKKGLQIKQNNRNIVTPPYKSYMEYSDNWIKNPLGRRVIIKLNSGSIIDGEVTKVTPTGLKIDGKQKYFKTMKWIKLTQTPDYTALMFEDNWFDWRNLNKKTPMAQGPTLRRFSTVII
jgi:hypothetical protein